MKTWTQLWCISHNSVWALFMPVSLSAMIILHVMNCHDMNCHEATHQLATQSLSLFKPSPITNCIHHVEHSLGKNNPLRTCLNKCLFFLFLINKERQFFAYIKNTPLTLVLKQDSFWVSTFFLQTQKAPTWSCFLHFLMGMLLCLMVWFPPHKKYHAPGKN